MRTASEILHVTTNAWERWVIDFGPIPLVEPVEGEENRQAIFVVGTAQRMVEAALGSDIERDQVSAVLIQFVPYFDLGQEFQQDELANNRLANVVG
jgi:hypothetical protein